MKKPSRTSGIRSPSGESASLPLCGSECLRPPAPRRRIRQGAARSRDGEGRYRHVLESVRAIIVETDDQGRFAYVSPTISEVLGYAPEELLNRRNLQGIGAEDRWARQDSNL